MRTLRYSVASTIVSIATVLAALPTSAGTIQPSMRWLIGVSPQRPQITDEVVAQIHPGLSEGEVRALIGPPPYRTRFPRSNVVAWDYDYRDPWGYDSTFSVIFDDAGFVVGRIGIRSGG